MAKEILCGFGVDVDAVAGWLGSYGGEDSPDDISRGIFAGEVGSLRLLKLFGRLDIKTTWFIPGHSIETFPAEMQAVADAGRRTWAPGPTTSAAPASSSSSRASIRPPSSARCVPSAWPQDDPAARRISSMLPVK
jgi:peptidoglycan/xylan/chitin deacetylase (PgdA/CDA1 family)